MVIPQRPDQPFEVLEPLRIQNLGTWGGLAIRGLQVLLRRGHGTLTFEFGFARVGKAFVEFDSGGVFNSGLYLICRFL